VKVRVEASDALGAFEEALLEARNRGYSPRLAIIGSNVFFGLLHQLWRMGQLGVVPEKISNCPVIHSRAINPDVIEIIFEETVFKSLIAKLTKKTEAKDDVKQGGTCCVCGHPLSLHVDEGEYWRCHALGGDGPQCECRLLKNPGLGEVPLEFYEYERRLEEFTREMLGGLKTKEEKEDEVS